MRLYHRAFLVCLLAIAQSGLGGGLPPLRVSDNQRFLVTADGRPFFYLGDTAWELFHRLNREEADRYLKDRAGKGFNVIQAVALAELDGLTDPNPYGHLPLLDNDPTRPDVREGPDNDYWDHVDWIVARANALGMYVGFLPTWGDKWNRGRRGGPEIFTPENAGVYGEWLGRRYKDGGIIWIVGGDRLVETDNHRQIIRAMAEGLRRGDGGAHLITFHPWGARGSADYFHGEPWLDFNMRQNGHVAEYNPRFLNMRVDYERTPPKPLLDGEPMYEDHPIGSVSETREDRGFSVTADVRRQMYWNLFMGACGHTYGHHSVWQMWSPPRERRGRVLMSWQEALDRPGAAQMQHGKNLLLSRPYFSRIPDDSVIVEDAVPAAVPGAGLYRFVATRDADGSYAMVYAPVGRSFQVRMDRVKGPKVRAWWFNPRTGRATSIGTFPNTGTRTFESPEPGEVLDLVLVLDDASRKFPPPGRVR